MRFAPRVSRLLLAFSFFILSLPVHAESPAREMLRFVDGASAGEQPVRIDLAALASRRVLIPLLDGQTVVADRSDLEVRGQGDFAWRGRIAGLLGEAAGDVTLTVQDGRVLGRIVVPGAAWRIVPVPEGGHRMEELEEVPLDEPEMLDLVPLSEILQDEEGDQQEEEGDVPRLLAAEAAPARKGGPISRFKVIAFYTPEARIAIGGEAMMRQSLQHEVDLANTAYANSQIQVRLEMPYMEEVLRPNRDNGNGYWVRLDPHVVELQRQHGAAFTALVVEEGFNGCAFATSIMRKDVFRDLKNTVQGGTVINRRCLGTEWVLLAHELGHVQGCEHDPAAGSPLGSALFPYAYGHYVDGSFRTVMSYANGCKQGCPAVPYFSNPAISFNGKKTGVPRKKDNHRVINATRTRIAPPPARGSSCRSGLSTLCTGSGRFKIQVDWYNQFSQQDGVGRPIQGSDGAGFFTFEDPTNVELMVKVQESGNSVRVSYGQLTSVFFTLFVIDTQTGRYKVYHNTPGECGGADQNAFPATAAASKTTAAAAKCTSGSGRLCLQKGRFEVTAEWRDPASGQGGQAGATPLSQVSGAFHFGNGNPELVTKIINQGGRIDVYYGSLSNLEYTIKVTDTKTGAVKTYRNTAGRHCGGTEIDAF
ncbi:MAG TPA: M12 family metallo-peptidase [Thermoanaerobaculia bacterium]|nr:M12 family metallo-peptidase [Thermoanaerobaculia bacterium]